MKRILLLLGLGALFTAFFINIGGVDCSPTGWAACSLRWVSPDWDAAAANPSPPLP